MSSASRIASLVCLAGGWLFAQQQPGTANLGERDIRVVRAATPAELERAPQVPRGYAIVIGVAKYKSLPAEQFLQYSESDAEAVYRTLISREGGNILPENVKKLIGPQATLANIREAIEGWLPRVTQESDRVIIYFAGHGIVDGRQRGYLAPYDVRTEQIETTGYPMAQLGQVLGKQVKAKWKVLLTDACHSGKITPETSQEAVYQAVNSLPSNFLTLTSSRENEVSFEDPTLAGGFGLFSYYVTQGWQGNADVDPRDGLVTADELIEYVRREVRSYARRRGRNQNPSDKGDFPNDLILGFSPARRATLTAAPAGATLANGVLLIETNLEDVEVYVDDQLAGKASPGKALQIPGLASGNHTLKGVRSGYEPAIREVTVYPGQTQTINLRLQYVRPVKKAAQALYEQGYEIAKRKRGEGDLKKAAELFQRALKEDDKFSKAAHELCLVEQALGNTEGALKAGKRAVQTDPDFVEARVQYGAVLIEAGDAPEAVRQLSEAARRAPRDAFVHGLLAEAFLRSEAHDKAEEAASKALEIDPAQAAAYLYRGDARSFQKRHGEAVADYRRYLELSNFDASLGSKIAYHMIGMGITKKNAGWKRQYRNQKSSAYFGLCWSELQLQNVARAVSYCEKAVEIDREDAFSWNLLGAGYLNLFNRDQRRGDLERAKGMFERALELNPAGEFAPEAKQHLAQIKEILPLVR